MNKNEKIAAGAAAAAGLGVLIYALTRTPGIPPDGSGGGDLSLELYDQYGHRIAGNSEGIGLLPASVVEGTVLSAVLRVANSSIQRTGAGDVPIAANMWLSFTAYAAGAPGEAQIIWAPFAEKQFLFAAGETKTITATEWPALRFTVSLGANGTVVAVLRDPNKVTLNSAVVSLTITTAPIIYGGTIIFS